MNVRRILRPVARLARICLTWLDLALGIGFSIPFWIWSWRRPVHVQLVSVTRIGHLVAYPEVFLAYLSDGARSAKGLWLYPEGRVSNLALLNKWRERFRIGPSWLLGPVYRASIRFRWTRLSHTDWPYGSDADLRPLDHCSPGWSFDSTEKALGMKLLGELNLGEDRPYICLAVRDGAYLRATIPNMKWDYHDYRDSKISDYELMAVEFANRGYAVVRMGRVVESSLSTANPHVVDYATSTFRSDFADLWLFANCAFCVSTSTGMDAMAWGQRRPVCNVNIGGFASLRLGQLMKLVMFKDIVDVDTGEVLGLLDERRMQAMTFGHISEVTEMGLQFRDNTPAELAAFAVEMVDLLEGRWQPTPEQIEVEQEFLSRIPGPLDFTQANFHISPSWLRSHSQVE